MRTLFTRASAFSASQAAAAATRCASRRCSRNSSSAVGPKLRASAAAAHGRPLGTQAHGSTSAARSRPPGRQPTLADAPGDAPQQAAGQALSPFSLHGFPDSRAGLTGFPAAAQAGGAGGAHPCRLNHSANHSSMSASPRHRPAPVKSGPSVCRPSYAARRPSSRST